MSLPERLDRFQRKHTWAGFPLAVVYKFVDDQGSYLAALVVYYGLLSLLPILLLLTSLLGFFLSGNPELQQQLLDGALGQVPLLQEQIGRPEGLQGSGLALVFALVLTLYGTLGVAQAVQNVMNTAWAVPRNSRGNPLLVRGRSLLLLGTAGIGVVATTVLTATISSGSFFGVELGAWNQVAVLLLSVGVNTGVAVVGFRIATAVHLRLEDVLPGAIGIAVVWQLLQLFGASYISRVVAGSSTSNAVFAFVLGLIGWLYLAGVALVLCVEVNVVRARHLHPRALLTPFTDHVDLTGGDQRSYTAKAKAERAKGFQTVDVTFEHDGQYASAHRHEEADRPA